MSVDAKIAERLNELVKLGREVLATRESPSPGHVTTDFVDVQLANQWLMSCLSLLSKLQPPRRTVSCALFKSPPLAIRLTSWN